MMLRLTLIFHIVLASVMLSGCQSGKNKSVAMYDDRIIGWYKLGSGIDDDANVNKNDTLVPILKRGNEFYTICRGFEMPLGKSPVGLEWTFKPSSMEGTAFVFCGPGWPCHLKIYDSQKSVFDWYEPGKKYKLIKIPEPEGLTCTVEKKPEVLDDFIGMYQPVYFPLIRIEISKEGDGYIHSYFELRVIQDTASWLNMGQVKSVKPLENNRGFLIAEEHAKNYLMFSEELNRYEIIIGSTGLRMPLVKISAGEDLPLALDVNLGIPSWN